MVTVTGSNKMSAGNALLNGTDYAVSTGGLIGMMKNLSTRLAQYNISVNDVAPAMIGGTGMIPDPNRSQKLWKKSRFGGWEP